MKRNYFFVGIVALLTIVTLEGGSLSTPVPRPCLLDDGVVWSISDYLPENYPLWYHVVFAVCPGDVQANPGGSGGTLIHGADAMISIGFNDPAAPGGRFVLFQGPGNVSLMITRDGKGRNLSILGLLEDLYSVGEHHEFFLQEMTRNRRVLVRNVEFAPLGLESP